MERCLLQQAAVADVWAGAREVAEKTAAVALEKDRAAQGAWECSGGGSWHLTAPAGAFHVGRYLLVELFHAGPRAAVCCPMPTGHCLSMLLDLSLLLL